MSHVHTNAVFNSCQPDLSQIERHVLLQLAWHSNANGNSYPSIETIVKRTRTSKSSVIRALKKLESTGILTRSGKHRQTNRYHLNVLPDSDECQGDAQEVSGRQSKSVSGTSKGFQGDTPTSKQPLKNQSRNKGQRYDSDGRSTEKRPSTYLPPEKRDRYAYGTNKR